LLAARTLLSLRSGFSLRSDIAAFALRTRLAIRTRLAACALRPLTSGVTLRPWKSLSSLTHRFFRHVYAPLIARAS